MSKYKLFAPSLGGSILPVVEDLKKRPHKNKSLLLWESKIHNRFFRDPPILRFKTRDPWIRQVLKSYAQYFIEVLTERMNQREGEKYLAQQLAQPCGQSSVSDLKELEREIADTFSNKKFHFLGGRTLPYWGPYIWEKTRRKSYTVNLPEGPQKLTVYFMSNFHMISWLHFATFGVYSTGGWAKPEGLYCVEKMYALHMEKETFKVTYLKHEAQHFSDYQNYPQLEQADLEYRAKLVEAIYSSSYKTLDKFLGEGRNNRQAPHVYASHVLVKNLSHKIFGREVDLDWKSWRKVDLGKIQKAARQIFEEHTSELKRRGAGTVTQVI